MPFTCAFQPLLPCLPEAGQSQPPDPHDGDDGIHIVSVTRLDQPGVEILSVVVSWFEDERWIEETVELSD